MAGRPLSRFREQLPAGWPDHASHEAYDVAVRLNAAMTREWPVWDVELESAVDAFNAWARAELDRGGLHDATDEWVDAFDDGDTDAPLRAALTWYYRNH